MMEMRNYPNIEQLVQRLTAIVANQNNPAPQPAPQPQDNPQLPVHDAQQAAPLEGDVAPVEDAGEQQNEN